MTAATLQNLLDWFATPLNLQTDAVPNEQAPTYPADTTPPTAEQIRGLKELLSPEAWLYLLRADDATPVDELQVQRKQQEHIDNSHHPRSGLHLLPMRFLRPSSTSSSVLPPR